MFERNIDFMNKRLFLVMFSMSNADFIKGDIVYFLNDKIHSEAK